MTFIAGLDVLKAATRQAAELEILEDKARAVGITREQFRSYIDDSRHQLRPTVDYVRDRIRTAQGRGRTQGHPV